MSGFEKITQRESGLKPQLSAGQMAMIAIGGAIGTGLFLGSGFAIKFAGPSVLLSYAIGAVISLLLMACLAEMTVTHPTSGSFGAYAEHYIGPLAGFLVRYAYWSCLVLAVGTEVTAVGIYMGHWFSDVPQWYWVLSFSAALVGINMMSVKTFGAVEYAFSIIKIIAIVGFILMGAYVVFGTQTEGVGFANYTAHGGFFPNGFWGTWVGVIIAIFSYLSIEMIAVAAGEAKEPQRAIKTAFKSTMVRLVVFYLTTLMLMLAIVPWTQAGQEGTSPFVKVMEMIGSAKAADILNFVVLIAALSAMNSQLYITTRIMFSLSRARQAPYFLGKVNSRGVPMAALLLSCTGITLACLLNALIPDESFLLMMALSMFGAMFTWLMIFVTHLFFRRQWNKNEGAAILQFKMWGFPWLTQLGAALMLSILISTLFTEAFRWTVLSGIPFLLLLTIAYQLWFKQSSTV